MDPTKYAPVSRAAAVAAGATPPAGPSAEAAPRSSSSDRPARRSRKPAKAPAPAEPPADAPKFVGGALRRLTIPLKCPLEYRGKLYAEITLRRPTAKEVGEYFERLNAEPETWHAFPIFVDHEDQDVPAEVIRGLDDEDDEIVMAKAQDFLSPRLLAARAL